MQSENKYQVEVKNFLSTVSAISERRCKSLWTKEQAIDWVIKNTEPTCELLESLRLKLKREYSIDANAAEDFVSIRDYFERISREQEELRDAMRETKREKQLEKTTAQYKTAELKNQIEQLEKQRLELESQLKEPQIPLIMRLMSSKHQ